MTWQEACNQHPDQWLLVEALDAHTDGQKRVINQLSVVGAFATSTEAFTTYQRLHRESLDREFYVYHSSQPTLDVFEQKWLGLRL